MLCQVNSAIAVPCVQSIQLAEEDESVSQFQNDKKNVADYMGPRFIKDDHHLVQFLGCSTVIDSRYKQFMVREYNEDYDAVRIQIIEEASLIATVVLQVRLPVPNFRYTPVLPSPAGVEAVN